MYLQTRKHAAIRMIECWLLTCVLLCGPARGLGKLPRSFQSVIDPFCHSFYLVRKHASASVLSISLMDIMLVISQSCDFESSSRFSFFQVGCRQAERRSVHPSTPRHGVIWGSNKNIDYSYTEPIWQQSHYYVRTEPYYWIHCLDQTRTVARVIVVLLRTNPR